MTAVRTFTSGDTDRIWEHLNELGAALNGDGWTDLPLMAGFTYQGGTPAQFRLVGDHVEMRWGVSSTGFAASSGGTQFATLPAEARPSVSKYFPVASSTAAGMAVVYVNTAGGVYLRTGSVLGDYYILDPVRFQVGS